MLVIGSKALTKYTTREVKDFDAIATETEIDEFLAEAKKHEEIEKIVRTEYYVSVTLKKHGLHEFFIATEGNALYDILMEQDAVNCSKTANLHALYTLKKSHIHFPTKLEKFEKHARDISTIYSLLNGEHKLAHITDKLFKETEIRLGKLRTPKLAKATKNFFKQSEDYVKYYFVHDNIHEVMAHNERPMYEKMQPDPTKAYCSQKMWNNFTLDERIKCVLEEAYVIALERKIIPMMFGGEVGWTSKDAVRWSLMRICTNLCSGWFREFAINHYNQIWEAHNPDYVTKFLTAYQEGKIKLNT